MYNTIIENLITASHYLKTYEGLLMAISDADGDLHLLDAGDLSNTLANIQKLISNAYDELLTYEQIIS